MPAELDYAFLADYAAVEGGRLTAVGASFTHMVATTLPFARQLTIAGRVRTPEDSDGFELGVVIRAPENQWTMDLSGFLEAGPNAVPYDGKKGILFAAQMLVTFTAPGLHVVEMSIDGSLVRTLKFDLATV